MKFTVPWLPLSDRMVYFLLIFTTFYKDHNNKWGEGGLVSECFGRPIFILLLKKTGFAPWLRNMLSQIIYYWQEIFLLESDVRQWSQPYYCIICELNQSRECVVNLNVTSLGFVFVLISLFNMPDAVVVS